MAWIKLNDNATRHPKVSGLSDRAFRAWVSSLCYASEFLTDGQLPVAFLLQIKRKIQDELLDSGLWSVSGNGSVSIHDYLGHQSDKASVSRKKERNKERQQRHRNAVTNTVTNEPVTQPENREQRIDTENREQKVREVPRARATGNGANEPGSLPRDHMHHSICGPSLRLCLKSWECGELMKAYGGDPSKQKAGVAAFVAAFEKTLGPDDSLGTFSWLEKHFQAWLHKIGRPPASPAKPAQPAQPATVPASEMWRFR